VRRNRKPTGHQRQIRFFTFFFGTLMILVVVALLWLLNRLPTAGH
jgi:hypothetical protein